MEYVMKVNAQAIENKTTKAKFIVFNTYIKDGDNWVKFNVKFAKDTEQPKGNAYIYFDKENLSVNEIGKYPTFYIKKVNRIQELVFDTKNLNKYFKEISEAVEKADEVDLDNPFGSPVDEADLPFDTKNGKGND